jgi:hypothetical protein
MTFLRAPCRKRDATEEHELPRLFRAPSFEPCLGAWVRTWVMIHGSRSRLAANPRGGCACNGRSVRHPRSRIIPQKATSPPPAEPLCRVNCGRNDLQKALRVAFEAQMVGEVDVEPHENVY